ncbi:MAG: Crp/Fnr family transcriptional regulator [Oscillospiraceae bacterium]|nr:Crp/Fnr family transcriptional regulator [Oscillospiraceae bacterium]
MFDIKELFLFKDLSADEVSRITARLPAQREFRRGELIFAPGEFTNAVGVFLRGKGVARTGGVFKNTFAEGSAFGAAAVFGAGETYISDIVAKTDCTVQFIPEAALREMIRAYPVCAENYIAFLSDRIRYLNRKIGQFTGGASARLYRYLADNADGEGRVAAGNMSALARLTGMGRTSLYRALGELESAGAVTRENGKIIVR